VNSYLSAMHKTVITQGKAWFDFGFKELYRYRELLWILTWRDLKVRYAQTIVGVLWAIINPLFTLLVLTFVFKTVADVDTGGYPHLLFTLSGMAGWTYFSSVVAGAGGSIISAQQMVTKVYFPRLLLPLSKAVGSLVDLAVVLVILTIMLFWYGHLPSTTIVWLPLFIALAILAGVGIGLWISAMSIRFRDFMYVTPLLLRLGMFITPIAYPVSSVGEKWEQWMYLNPMTGIIEGMRWSILGIHPPGNELWITIVVVLVIFASGLFVFNRIERKIADII
jgi:lipopolysaccharide transport system permease protein